MFFTKWGHSAPTLERCKMDGTEREAIITRKIVYPYGVVVDYPVKHVYWVDTYLDYVERADYDGQNRKNIMKGVSVQNLYGITIFENRLFVTSWHNNSILTIHKFQQVQKTVLGNISRPFNLHVFHRQRQPDGKFEVVNSILKRKWILSFSSFENFENNFVFEKLRFFKDQLSMNTVRNFCYWYILNRK